MPYGHPTIAIALLDFDDGDDRWNGYDWEAWSESLSQRMIRFVYSDHARKKDKMELSLRNDDFGLFDAPMFVKGQKLLVTWGWPGQTAAPRRVVVTSVKGSDPITVVGHDTVALLDRDRRSRFMAGVTDAEFVRAVADEHGYKGNLAHIDETDERRDITQARWMTDAKMLRRLARRNGFEFYVDASGLHWHKRRTDREPVRVYIYRNDPGRGSILEPPVFDANLSKGVARVRVLGYDPVLQEPVDEAYGVADDDEVSLGLEEEIEDPETATSRRAARISMEDVVPGGLITATGARIIAKAVYRETAKGRYKMRVPLVGDARLAAKSIVGFYDMADTLDGLFYVQELVHEIVPGSYRMVANCQKDALGKVSAAKKGKKRSPNKQAAAQEPPPEQAQFKKMIKAVVRADGTVVPSYIFTDDGGATGQTSELTPEEFNQLSVAQKEELAKQGAQSALPDE